MNEAKVNLFWNVFLLKLFITLNGQIISVFTWQKCFVSVVSARIIQYPVDDSPYPRNPVDLCENKCGPNAECQLFSGHALCGCWQGYEGNPYDRNYGCRPGKEDKSFTVFISFNYNLSYFVNIPFLHTFKICLKSKVDKSIK